MFQRIVYGLLLIAGLVVIFWGDITIATGTVGDSTGEAAGGLTHGTIIPLAVLMLAICGTLELLALCRSCGYLPMGGTVIIGVIALNLTAWLMPAIYPDASIRPLEWELIVLMLTGMLVGLVQVIRHRTTRGIGDISVSVMIVVYMGILPSMIIALRAALPGALGAWAVLLFIAVVKGTDIGAYFTGVAVGKTKLIPAISPNKTVEGCAGGLVLAMILAVVLARILPWSQSPAAPAISTVQAVLFGAVIAAFGQVGDLVESVFKRDAFSKDSGAVIPGFGGVLDLLDSPVFAAPLAYLLLNTWLSHDYS